MNGKLPDDLVVVDCAGCKALLSSEKQPRRVASTSIGKVAGRIKGRPFCAGCLNIPGAGVSGLAGGMAGDFGSPSPWSENANRAREDS